MLAKIVLALTAKYLKVASPIFIGKHLNKLKMNDFFLDPSENWCHRVKCQKPKTKRKSWKKPERKDLADKETRKIITLAPSSETMQMRVEEREISEVLRKNVTTTEFFIKQDYSSKVKEK